MNPTTTDLINFRQTIWAFYERHGRSFAWRHVDDPYKVVISEVMLQQTQTHRVIDKFELFLLEFPSFEVLSNASLKDVLSVWQGLGYNRRGMYLHQLGQKVVAEYKGILPADPVILKTFPGIGPATAASICAFAFNMPTFFIETNIRTVFIHFFFQGETDICDKDIMSLVEKTVDKENPREWYYALMDYGVMLKKTIPNPSRKSKHYTKQSKFEGSDRQMRGKIIKLLTDQPTVKRCDLIDYFKSNSDRIDKIVGKMLSDGLIKKNSDEISIA